MRNNAGFTLHANGGTQRKLERVIIEHKPQFFQWKTLPNHLATRHHPHGFLYRPSLLMWTKAAEHLVSGSELE
ncbi:hypothetical protein Q8A67_022003 [Cirrhinus molitorella]|uniref:Uncharacterized protein n=1 Tax=Cirrhinus molitorella TaxID=172907 RepID=A0AA88PBV4_9TELE|nr:hypothetical protein Q8A67_022003 [Cirrhinus molitorella]